MDPKAFKIIDGKLYLNWDTESAEQFGNEAPRNIENADAHWESLTRKH